jgi:hypothetical protein
MKTKTIANIKVGKAQVDPMRTAHIRGVREGNAVGNMRDDDGLEPDGEGARGNARRSTGISAKSHEPIDPKMPRLSPC